MTRDRIDGALDRLATQAAQCSSADHRERVLAQVNEIRSALDQLFEGCINCAGTCPAV